MQRTATGTWGGRHITIAVNGRSAYVEYDCADGTIEGPLTFDSNGNFSWRGTHSRGHGGPIRIDEKPNSRSAIFTGSIVGDTMTLTVKLADNDQELGTFSLTRGNPGRLWKCK